MALPLSLLVCLTAIPSYVRGQTCPYVAGYASDVKGEILEYNSADPDVRSALLVRSLRSERYIEWTTDPIPSDYPCDHVTFTWLFGMDASSERHEFDLLVNGEPWFRLSNPSSASENRWSVEGRNGSRVSFRGTFVDRHNDLFGYASLRLRVTEELRGKALRLRVVGESADSRIWYMTFRSTVQSQIRVRQQPTVVWKDGKRHHLISIKIEHLAELAPVRLELPDGEPIDATVEFGSNRIDVPIPEAVVPRDLPLKISVGDIAYERVVALKPVRDWQVYLVQHTHTDIGYTRPQTEILPDHIRYLDRALEYCDRTDHLPDDARFRWTCESSWPVDAFLRTRSPRQIERLKQRILEGRIEITSMFVNMSEIVDESTYVASLQPLRRFRKLGLPVTTAMQNDVNGFPWCLVDYFPDIGIKYVTMGEHGHRALIPFDVPTAFWWESPGGERVLAYRPDHYNTGNFWGIHNGRLKPVERELLRYLEGLEERGYPHDRVAVQYSGYFTDNSPPSMVACDLVEKWNRKYASPHLRLATAREFLTYVEKHHADELPVYRVAWPDWWTDGVGSAARETSIARTTQTKLAAAESVLGMASLLGAKVDPALMVEARRIHDSLLFYGEHTYGSAESIREPLAHNSTVQWSQKAAYAWEAAKSAAGLEDAAVALLERYLPGSQHSSLVVVNTLNWPRAGLHEIYIDHESVPKGKTLRLVGSDGRRVAVQRLSSRADGTYWAVWFDQVPALGIQSYRIEIEETPRDTPPPVGTIVATPLENRYYRIKVNAQTGAIESLYDKELQEELVDASAPWQLGQVIHEALGNREQLEQFKLEEFERTSLTNVDVKVGARGDIWTSLVVTGDTPTCHGPQGLRCEIRLYSATKLIELRYAAKKKQVFEPEALYVAFPFQLPGGRIAYEAQGGVARPDVDLLPRSASDWQTVQSFAAVRGSSAQILLSTTEVPLMQFGGINLGEFRDTVTIDRPHMYSWVMNNYWTTNFRASQQGEFRWSYQLTSTRDTGNVKATRFGWNSRVPFVSSVLSARQGSNPPMSGSLVDLTADNVLLVGAWPARDGDGMILHLREVEGRRSEFRLRPSQDAIALPLPMPRVLRLTHVNVLEEVLADLEGKITLDPFEVMFVKVSRAQ